MPLDQKKKRTKKKKERKEKETPERRSSVRVKDDGLLSEREIALRHLISSFSAHTVIRVSRLIHLVAGHIVNFALWWIRQRHLFAQLGAGWSKPIP